MTEQQPYTRIRSYEGFELRQYPDSAVVQVEVEGDFDRAGNRAFRPLFEYISGSNVADTRFAMTAPVTQQELPHRGNLVAFVLPHEIDRDAIPAPRDGRVTTSVIPAHTAAALRFRGGWSEQLFRRKRAELLAAVAAAGLTTRGEVVYARFDPPWMPGPLKHNEALIEVVAP